MCDCLGLSDVGMSLSVRALLQSLLCVLSLIPIPATADRNALRVDVAYVSSLPRLLRHEFTLKAPGRSSRRRVDATMTAGAELAII